MSGNLEWQAMIEGYLMKKVFLLTPAIGQKISDKNMRPKLNVLNPWKLKKYKSRELFGSYQLISSTNQAHT